MNLEKYGFCVVARSPSVEKDAAARIHEALVNTIPGIRAVRKQVSEKVMFVVAKTNKCRFVFSFDDSNKNTTMIAVIGTLKDDHFDRPHYGNNAGPNFSASASLIRGHEHGAIDILVERCVLWLEPLSAWNTDAKMTLEAMRKR